jgi:hypothetical protein
VENPQLTTFKYGANNPKWSPMVKNIILIKYFITRTTKDSILNKSYTNLDNGKPGFKKNEHLIANSASPILTGVCRR